MSAGASIHLLIVDDEDAQQAALCTVLAQAGYTSRGFTAGAQALEALKHQSFQLMLTDLSMPGIGGLDLLRAAQQIDPDLVGVMMTGHGSIDTAIDAMKAGALDYILKPFSLSDILPVLSRAIDIRRLRIENASLQRSLLKHVGDLESANTELDAFSRSVSHDLRAPLRIIAGFAQLLERNYDVTAPAEARQQLRTISSAAGRMSQLIEDLLRFSRVNQHPIEKHPVNMTELVHGVMSELGTAMAERHIEVRQEDLPPALGDVSLLRQVYANLLSNACKFSRHQQRPIITIGCTITDKATYFVRDNGAGFSMQDADRLFGVFQRLHSDSEFEGTGIGLSLTQRIIHRHGGNIWAEAEVGKGAAFYFTLPLAGGSSSISSSTAGARTDRRLSS